jgi:hypothetical protein
MFADVTTGRMLEVLERRDRQLSRHRGMQALNVKTIRRKRRRQESTKCRLPKNESNVSREEKTYHNENTAGLPSMAN